MRSIFYSLFLFCCTHAEAQQIGGDWQGTLSVGGRQIRLVFHIVQKGETYSATFDSPDQGAMGIAASGVTVKSDSVHIAIAQVGGGYDGKWNGADAIDGVLSQGPVRMPVALKRQQPGVAIGKPQTPRPPFDYLAENVAYENTKQQVHLEGSFTRPKNGTKFPVVLLITGSGPQDRDETIGLHKSFWVIADHLAKQGIAVLRVDDRGVGKSTGNFPSATTADFATDVMAGIDYLKTRTDVDVTKIGLLGHSEGAILAPYVAARSKDVAFIVMLAGPVEGGINTMYYQAVTKPLASLPPTARDAYGALYRQLLDVGLQDSAAKNLQGYITRVFNRWKQQQSVATLSALLHGAGDKEVIEGFVSGFKDLQRPWWRFFLTYDPSADLKKITVPVLALNGSNDEQVDPRNLKLIETLLRSTGNQRFKTYEVPGVNHLFQHCRDCGSIQEYLALDETIDPQTLAVIGDWIKQQVN